LATGPETPDALSCDLRDLPHRPAGDRIVQRIVRIFVGSGAIEPFTQTRDPRLEDRGTDVSAFWAMLTPEQLLWGFGSRLSRGSWMK
jgi:hypothetical protein